MTFHFYSGVHFEQWDWRNSVEKGIGGSETNHVEMAWRLARRGHEVNCYAPIPDDCSGEWRGTKWFRLDQADFSQAGVWLVYRQPELLDRFDKRDDQIVWFVAQDEWYSGFTEERVAKIDRFLAFCPEHAKLCVSRCPKLKPKVWITSNGLKSDLVRESLAQNIERNPHRLMYASSPDRGLKHLLKIFSRAREHVPSLELHCFYGFDNIDKLIKHEERFKHYTKVKAEIESLMDQPNVHWHGRVSQQQLYQEWLASGIWCYPTNFFETSCITCMEAQALGAVPITNPIGALANNVRYGTFVQGDAWGDQLVQARYAAEIVRMATMPGLQDQIRRPMMKEAVTTMNWERWVDQWESALYGWGDRYPWCQYNFQIKHARGRVLNIGCDVDYPGFGKRGGVNVDIKEKSPIMGEKTAVDIVADARCLPPSLYGEFDSVVLGDILEHMSDEDATKCLQNARRALRNGGDIIVTCPNDSRPTEQQHDGEVEAYADGESSYHVAVPRERIDRWIAGADLVEAHYQELWREAVSRSVHYPHSCVQKGS